MNGTLLIAAAGGGAAGIVAPMINTVADARQFAAFALAGGVQRITYKGGKLAIKMKGGALSPLSHPPKLEARASDERAKTKVNGEGRRAA